MTLFPSIGQHRGFLPALLISMALAGCQPFYLNSIFRPKPPPLPAAEPAAPTRPEPPAASEAGPISASTVEPAKQTRPRPKVAASPEQEANKAPVLTLSTAADSSNEAVNKRSAERAVDEALRQLAVVDRAKLSPSGAANYDLVTGFIRGAQEALREEDFVKAQSLARKASVLAEELTNRSAPGH